MTWLDERHQEHYKGCGCLGDSARCCDPTCACSTAPAAQRLIEVTIGLWPDNDPPGMRPPRLAVAIVQALHDEGYAITREALCARSGGCRD